MRRTSTRKGGAAAAVSSSASSKAVLKEAERIDDLFYFYADTSSGVIDPEGIEAFCSDLGVAHTDVRILMLAWKMGAQKQGYFTLEEWQKGFKALRADSMGKLKRGLVELHREVSRPFNFEGFYSFSFRFCLTEEKQKCIDIESACELLHMVLGLKCRPQADKLIQYLKYQHDYKVINMDQWIGFLRFCNEINFPSLDNYDPTYAWPLVLDNFVEWMQGGS